MRVVAIFNDYVVHCISRSNDLSEVVKEEPVELVGWRLQESVHGVDRTCSVWLLGSIIALLRSLVFPSQL